MEPRTPQRKEAVGEEEKESALRRAIADVFADASLTPAEKFAKVGRLRQQQPPVTPVHVRDDNNDHEEEEDATVCFVCSKPARVACSGCGGIMRYCSLACQRQHFDAHRVVCKRAQLPVSEEPVVSACPHYKRGCLLQCNKCHKFVLCRLCHDEMDRFAVAALKCVACGSVTSPPSAACSSCGVRFATYVCTVCHTYDSTPDKQIFHCDACGICRIGTRESTRHCDRCAMCIVGADLADHACFENSFRSDCVACLRPLFDAVEGCSIMKCGHAMHPSCYRELLMTDYRCPTCKKAVADMGETWQALDRSLAESMELLDEDDLPEELRTRIVKCRCNDCDVRFEKNFNPFHTYKCDQCGGFNTNPI